MADLFLKIFQLVHDLLDLESGQLTKTIGHDGGGLRIVESEAFHDGLLGFGGAALTGTDGGDDLVDDVDGTGQSFQDMGAFLSLPQVELGTADDDLMAVINEMLDELFQVQQIRTTLDQGHVIHVEGALQGRHLVELVQDDLGIGVALQFIDDADALTVGLIADVGDAVQLLLVDQVGRLLDHVGLVDLIRDGGRDDALVTVMFLDGRLTTDHDPTLSRLEGLSDAFVAIDDATGGEIGSLDVFHQLRDGDIVVVDIGDDTVDALAEVVRGHVRGHTHSDAVAAVDQQCGDLCRQHRRLLQRVIEVILEIHGILVEVVQHLLGDPLQTGLGITHGCGAVAVDTTEVALAIDQRITQRPRLGHTAHGIVDGRVAVGMVLTQHLTDDSRRFLISAVGTHAQAQHAEKDTTMHRLQSVSHVRQGTRDDHGHRIIDVSRFHLILKVYPDDFFSR